MNTEVQDLLAELRSRLEKLGDKDCLSTLDQIDEAVSGESAEDSKKPLVDDSIDAEEQESPEEEAAETPDEEQEEVDSGTEVPPTKKKYPVEQFDTKGM